MPSWMDIAFTPSVKAVQALRGSREAYARKQATGTARTLIDDALAGFVAETRSFYLATSSRDGQPYVQHRGGPPGTGLAHYNERRRTRQMALSGGGPIEMATEEVEEAIKQALNTADDD